MSTPELIEPIIARPLRVKGFEHYLASYWGGFIINTRNGKRSRGTRNKEGYMRFDLRNKGKRSNQYVHRLICGAWKDNPKDKSDVNHIDRIRSNNDVPNLEYLTHAENMAYINSEPWIEQIDSAPF